MARADRAALPPEAPDPDAPPLKLREAHRWPGRAVRGWRASPARASHGSTAPASGTADGRRQPGDDRVPRPGRRRRDGAHRRPRLVGLAHALERLLRVDAEDRAEPGLLARGRRGGRRRRRPSAHRASTKGASARNTNRHLGQSPHQPGTVGSWMRKPVLQLMKVAWWRARRRERAADGELGPRAQQREAAQVGRDVARDDLGEVALGLPALAELVVDHGAELGPVEVARRGRALVGHHDRVAVVQQRRHQGDAGDDRGDRDVAVEGAGARSGRTAPGRSRGRRAAGARPRCARPRRTRACGRPRGRARPRRPRASAARLTTESLPPPIGTSERAGEAGRALRAAGRRRRAGNAIPRPIAGHAVAPGELPEPLRVEAAEERRGRRSGAAAPSTTIRGGTAALK